MSSPRDKPLAWLAAIAAPPMAIETRREAGYLLRKLQRGELLSMPESRPMPSIGKRCHELRIREPDGIWRIIYRIDPDAIVVVEAFKKKTEQTPQYIKDNCKKRLAQYDLVAEGKDKGNGTGKA